MSDPWYPTEWQVSHPLHWASGLYVIDYGDRIKFGRAGDLRPRLLQHFRGGGTDARCWRTHDSNVAHLEELALAAANRRGTRIGKSESYLGLTLPQAVTIVRGVLWDSGLLVDELRPTRDDLEASLVIRPWEKVPYHQTALGKERAS